MAYSFPREIEEHFQWLLTRYPKKDAVLLPLLHHVQKELGYLPPEALAYVGGRLNLSPARVREVASFYSMFRLDRQGKYVLQICHNLTCYLKGSDELIQKAEELLQLKVGETSADGLFSLERVECLASCSTAPVMQVNDWDFHEELTKEKLEKIVDGLRVGKAACPAHTERAAQGGVA